MIGYLEGNLHFKNQSSIVILVGGVGYQVEVVNSLYTLNEGDNVKAYIHTHVREDVIKLFGFSTKEELSLFEMLIGVSGVGPKGAMSIISTLGVSSIIEAIINEDSKVFKSVSGIGMKNAEKIVLELRNKIGKDQKEMVKGRNTNGDRDSLELALTSLGYSIPEVRRIENMVEYSDDVSKMVKDALKLLNK